MPYRGGGARRTTNPCPSESRGAVVPRERAWRRRRLERGTCRRPTARADTTNPVPDVGARVGAVRRPRVSVSRSLSSLRRRTITSRHDGTPPATLVSSSSSSSSSAISGLTRAPLPQPPPRSRRCYRVSATCWPLTWGTRTRTSSRTRSSAHSRWASQIYSYFVIFLSAGRVDGGESLRVCAMRFSTWSPPHSAAMPNACPSTTTTPFACLGQADIR